VERLSAPVESRLRHRERQRAAVLHRPVDHRTLRWIILGNLYREPLDKIWWGERYQSFRRDLQTADPPEPCRGCGVKWSL